MHLLLFVVTAFIFCSARLGEYIRLPEGYSVYSSFPFPPKERLSFSFKLTVKHAVAMQWLRALGKSAQKVEDKNSLLQLTVEANSSNADDTIHYIEALHHGQRNLEERFFSIPLLLELHKLLLEGARTTIKKLSPGQFRKKQNWIDGTSLKDALFLPPPVFEVRRKLEEIEIFVNENREYLPLIKAALMFAQFETIHPFLDGNGRLGRMLVDLFLCKEQILDLPLLNLSQYFRKHRALYCNLLQKYHDDSDIEPWIDFFLDAVIATAQSSLQIARSF